MFAQTSLLHCRAGACSRRHPRPTTPLYPTRHLSSTSEAKKERGGIRKNRKPPPRENIKQKEIIKN